MPPRLRKEPVSLDHMTEAEIAWVAGMYEGEGCLTHNGKVWCIRLGSTDLDIVERLHALTRMGTVQMPGPARIAQGGKLYYNWAVHSQPDLCTLVMALRPWMGARRGARADEYLEWFAEWRQHDYIRVLPTHCKRNHPYEGNRANGGGCRICRAEQSRQARARAKAARLAAAVA